MTEVQSDSNLVNTTGSANISYLENPDLIFCRKFRWTMRCDDLPSNFFRDVKIDYKNKVIEFSYYNVFVPAAVSGDVSEDGFHVLRWAKKPRNENETMVFSAYDGLGNTLYEVMFTGLEIIHHTSEYDYVDSGSSFEVVKLHYSTDKFIFLPSAPTRAK